MINWFVSIHTGIVIVYHIICTYILPLFNYLRTLADSSWLTAHISAVNTSLNASKASLQVGTWLVNPTCVSYIFHWDILPKALRTERRGFWYQSIVPQAPFSYFATDDIVRVARKMLRTKPSFLVYGQACEGSMFLFNMNWPFYVFSPVHNENDIGLIWPVLTF